VTWVVRHWRLKLLALLLALGLLAAVAFSENPATVKSFEARVDYDNLPPGLVLVGPPKSVPVTVVGISGAVSNMGDSSVVVSVDMRRIANPATLSEPLNVIVTGHPKVLSPNVSALSDQVSIPLTVEKLDSRTLNVEVRTPRVAAGFQVVRTTTNCGNAAQACDKVTVTAPRTILQGLAAYVQYDPDISGESVDSYNQPIRFELNGKPFDFTKLNTIPQAGFDPSSMNIHIDAKPGTQSRTVALVAAVNGKPQCGYRVAGLDIAPGNGTTTVSGPADQIGKVGDSISLSPVDVTNATSTVSVPQTVLVPEGVSASPSRVTVSVRIDRQFDCSPATPAPTPAPSPSPSH
jgi:YbbR domain-containing protein